MSIVKSLSERRKLVCATLVAFALYGCSSPKLVVLDSSVGDGGSDAALDGGGDASADAGGDASADAGGDASADAAADASADAGTACDPQTGTGCSGSETCIRHLNGKSLTGTCGTAGTTAVQGACSTDADCAAGLVCIALVTGGPSTCRELCNSNDPAACTNYSTGAACALPFGPSTDTFNALCTSSCDVLKQTGCPAGQFCWAMAAQQQNVRITDCIATPGTALAGETCATPYACGAGLVCAYQSTSIQMGTCRSPCSTANDCPGTGAMCNWLSTSLSFGGDLLNVCQ